MVSVRKIKIPELGNNHPGKRVGINFQEIGYKGILIGGMTAKVTR